MKAASQKMELEIEGEQRFILDVMEKFVYLKQVYALRGKEKWNWFTGRNYCRKMCMDMVAIESSQELNDIGARMRGGRVRESWTSGRLCDAEVDDCHKKPQFQPYNINGWFWASTLQPMGPTNVFSGRQYNAWSSRGSSGQAQPDGVLKPDNFGTEACQAVMDNVFGDGLRWHDMVCAERRHIVCEDLPNDNINFVRNNNPAVNIP